jgi:hypothetical protein
MKMKIDKIYNVQKFKKCAVSSCYLLGFRRHAYVKYYVGVLFSLKNYFFHSLMVNSSNACFDIRMCLL